MATVALVTALAGLAIMGLAGGRILDVPPLNNRPWPGPFRSGGKEQKRAVVAVMPMGLGFALLGFGEALGRPGGLISGILFVAAAVNLAVAAFMFAGVLKPRA